MAKLLLDSVILIDHFNNIAQATHFISQNQTNIGISLITRAEVLTGFGAQKDLRLAQQLLSQFTTLPLTIVEIDLAASLRREYGWKLPDAIQAAVAKHHGLKLVTRNSKDFNLHKHSFVVVPYTLNH